MFKLKKTGKTGFLYSCFTHYLAFDSVTDSNYYKLIYFFTAA